MAKLVNGALSQKENVFFSFLTRFQLPSVKYVYAVHYKSMIGGYKTLFHISNEFSESIGNSQQIFESCLSHVKIQ